MDSVKTKIYPFDDHPDCIAVVSYTCASGCEWIPKKDFKESVHTPLYMMSQEYKKWYVHRSDDPYPVRAGYVSTPEEALRIAAKYMGIKPEMLFKIYTRMGLVRTNKEGNPQFLSAIKTVKANNDKIYRRANYQHFKKATDTLEMQCKEGSVENVRVDEIFDLTHMDL